MKNIFRADILAMPAYSSARSLYQGNADTVFLDANECGYEPCIGATGLSRYPSQQPKQMQDALCRLYDVSTRNMLVTRGADEGIDILIRACCEAGKDNVLICPPTFPMYSQAAILQNASVIEVPLKSDFSIDYDGIIKSASKQTKLVFVCSPNNPTASLVPQETIEKLCAAFLDKAFVVVDETYIEYANAPSVIPLIEKYSNLIILRTLSKAYAAAGLRCGTLVAQGDVVDVLRKVLAPYPIPAPVAQEVINITTQKNIVRLSNLRQETLIRRDEFIKSIKTLLDVEEVFPSCANFILVRVKDADTLCKKCFENGVILRNQSHQMNLKNCVRIAIGSDDDMGRLLKIWRGEKIENAKNNRTASITRKTNETAIAVRVDLDSSTPVRIHTGIGFYDHMLEQIAKHGGFSLQLECDGDLQIDPHHTIEDCAIALGSALRQALGDKRGIGRYGFTLPMDESLASCAMDLSGRFFLQFDAKFPENFVGDLPTDMVEHVFRSLAENMAINLHMSVTGENTHHMVEGCFKAFGRALRQAIKRDGGNDLPSSKGII